MPEPVKGDQKYLPGLDGLRALAVAAVVAYHLGYGWAQGGLLGVGVFFTLSGYLTTDILVGQWAARGRIKLGDFWLRRGGPGRARLVDGLGGLATQVAGPGGAVPYLTKWSRLALALVTLVLAAGSALLMVHLYQPGYDPTRVY